MLESEHVRVASNRRIGKIDQGTENRPRYLLIGFLNANDRNDVKKKGNKLKEKDDTKSFFIKADSTKQEREQYKKLYDLKKRIEEDEPEKEVKIEYGKLYVDGNLVEQATTDNKDFLWGIPAVSTWN